MNSLHDNLTASQSKLTGRCCGVIIFHDCYSFIIINRYMMCLWCHVIFTGQNRVQQSQENFPFYEFSWRVWDLFVREVISFVHHFIGLCSLFLCEQLFMKITSGIDLKSVLLRNLAILVV